MDEKKSQGFLFLELARIDRVYYAIINSCYEMWKETYGEILSAAGEKLSADSFFRSRFISIIHQNYSPIGFCLHSVYDFSLNGMVELPYFFYVGSHFLNKLENEKRRLLSIEWVTVHPEYRKRFAKVQYVDLVMGMGLEMLKLSSCDSTMGFSRKDLQADRIVAKYGVREMEEIVRHGISCAVMFAEVENLVEHPYRAVNVELKNLLSSLETNNDYLSLKEKSGGRYAKAG